MQFSKFAGKQAAAEKPATPTPTEPAPTEVEQAPTEVEATPMPAESDSRALALFGDDSGAEGASLLAVAAEAQAAASGGGAGQMFPILQITGGESGGQWKLVGDVPKEIARQFMPVTSDDTLDGVFVGFRVEMVAWPRNKRPEDEGTRPAWSAVLPATADAATRDLFLAAAEAFNFTPGADKHKFDVDTGGPGHLRPSFQALVYVPGPQGLIVIQPPALYSSWLESAESLAKLVDPKTGKLGRFPVRIKVNSRPVKYSSFTNKIHRVVFEKAIDTDGQAWLASFQSWRQHTLAEDLETAETVAKWMSGADAPITDEVLARLAKAKGLKPPR